MNNPKRALECVQDAREGGTLRAPDWDLIEQYLDELVSRGIHEPIELADRLERRGRCSEVDVVTGEAIAFLPIGRRTADMPKL